METYPPEFASKMKELAHDAALWIGSQVARDGRDADQRMDCMTECAHGLAALGVLQENLCQQLCDIAVTAAAVTLCREFGMAKLDEFESDFAAACQPQPVELRRDLWHRTLDMFCAAARLACAEHRGDRPVVHKEQRVFDRHARHLAGLRRVGMQSCAETHSAFSDEAARVIPATVVMLSTQLNRKVPESGFVEGRCTELLMEAWADLGDCSWLALLQGMQKLTIEKKGGTQRAADQVVVLSCSEKMDLDRTFGAINLSPSHRRRALLVGINYVGQDKLESHVGHKHALQMRLYLASRGFQEGDIHLLLDDSEHQRPNRANIESGMIWLTEDAQPGDSLFFHFSGYGCSFGADCSGERTNVLSDPGHADCDEALCPVDFRSAGMIFDDEIYRLLVAPLQKGVLLTCVVDCCQSGTILHLPYVFHASGVCSASTGSSSVEQVNVSRSHVESSSGAESDAATRAQMRPNRAYDPGKMLQVIQTHPAMCAAAAFWAEELESMNPGRNRRQLGSVLERVALSAQCWRRREAIEDGVKS